MKDSYEKVAMVRCVFKAVEASVVVADPKTLFSATLSLPRLSWLMALECADRSMELMNGLQVDLVVDVMIRF
jgi:hypothetical protein